MDVSYLWLLEDMETWLTESRLVYPFPNDEVCAVRTVTRNPTLSIANDRASWIALTCSTISSASCSMGSCTLRPLSLLREFLIGVPAPASGPSISPNNSLPRKSLGLTSPRFSQRGITQVTSN